MKHVLAWSGGKDSTASAIVAKEKGLPIDHIITLRPDPFKLEVKFAERFEEWMGMEIEVLHGPTFEDFFYMRKGENAKFAGDIYGWPMTVYRTCSRVLKTDVIEAWQEKQEDDIVMIVGIAADEEKRLKGLGRSGDISYLAQEGVTENRARTLCVKHNLLNPLYQYFDRLGCVRCPKQRIESLRQVRRLEPEKWQWGIDHDHESPVSFRANGRTFREIEYRIASGDRWADGRTKQGKQLMKGQTSYYYRSYATMPQG